MAIRRILEGVRTKILQSTVLFVDFTKVFDSIHKGKMEQILLAYSIPKETVAAIMILYRNTKVKVRSPDGDTDYLDNVAGVLQGDTLAPYLFIICLDYVLRTSIDKIKENGFELTKKRSRRYPAKTITNADYTNDIAILANAPVQAETQLHSLEQAAVGIGLHVNAHKTEYMWFNQTGDISTLGEKDRHTTSKGIDSYRSYGSQTWAIKWNIVSSKQRLCWYYYMDALHGRWLNEWKKSLRATTQEFCEQFWTSPGGNTPQSTSCTATYLPSRKLSKDEPDMQDTAGKAETSS